MTDTAVTRDDAEPEGERAPEAPPTPNVWIERSKAALRTYPVTIVFVVVVVVAGVVTGALWQQAREDPGLVGSFGYGLPHLRDGKPWTFLTGAFIMPTLVVLYIPILVALALVSAAYERRAGHWRLAAVALGGQVIGTALTAAFLAPFSDSGWTWAAEQGRVLDLGAASAVWAVLAALTAVMQPVWRTRVRIGVTAFLFAMVLNAGRLHDLEHLIVWIVAMLLGPLVLGRAPRPPRLALGRRTQRAAIALFVGVLALSSLIEAVFPGTGGPFISAGTRYESAGETFWVILSSLFWLVVADALRRGRRPAWMLSTIVTVLVLVLLFSAPPSSERTADIALYLIQLVLLLATFRAFTARAPHRAVRRAGRRLLVVVGVLFVYTAVGFAALKDDFSPTATPADMVGEFATRMFFSTTHAIEPTTTAARWFVGSIGAVWIAVILITLIGLIYSSRRSDPVPEQSDRLRELLRQSEPSSIEWMLTWDGNTEWFSADGQTAIGYRVVGSVALCLGDPVGPFENRLEILKEFDRFCFDNGWIPCLFGTGQKTADLAPQVGWNAVQVGEDSVVRLPDLEFKGKAWQDVRTALNKAGKQDVRLEVLHWDDAKPVITDQLGAISAGWVGDKALPEMGFTLGTLAEAHDPEVRLHLAIDADQTVEGFTSWMPVADRGEVVGWTIDLMRRRDQGLFRPVMEFMIGASAMQLKEEGYQFLSLSAAPLAKAPDHLAGNSDQEVLQKLLDFLGNTLEPYYGFRSLLAFKAKFQPEFHPIYLVFPDETALAEIGIAIARAYMPDAGLLDWVKMGIEMAGPAAHD